jgi:hypothetical protein
MKKLQSNYPLGQLLIAIFTETRHNLSGFVESLGYRNVNKGIRAFHQVLSTGYGPSIFFSRLEASPYAPSGVGLQLVLQQHFEQLSQEILQNHGLVAEDYQEEFRPIVHAIPALSDVESISFFAQSGDFAAHTVTLQRKVASLPLDQQYTVVGAKIRQNYRHTGGVIPCMGPTRYYLYYSSWEAPAMTFSVDGYPIGIADHTPIPKARVTKIRRTLDRKLIKLLLHAPADQPVH